MVKIYCIEDCNNLKYVGSTKRKLSKRLSDHKSSKKCSSRELDLDNCKIYVLEETDEENRLEREKYWIHKIDCVNIYRYDYDKKQNHKQYCEKNIDKIKQKQKRYRHYRNSFGGDERFNNNLLLIDLSIFN